MEPMTGAQQCKHCERAFFRISLWQEHFAWHTSIQLQLGRPATQDPGQEPESSSAAIDQITDLASCIQLESDDVGHRPHRDPPGEDEESMLEFIPTDDQMEQYLQRAIADFPPYEGGGVEIVTPEPEIKCPDCDFLFYSQEQLDEHYLSKYCKGNQISLYIMTMDSSKIGGYRVFTESVPFESKTAFFKCEKCNHVFATDPERQGHEMSHRVELLKCLHCEKILQSQIELEKHYCWHDDMHLRHHIDRIHRLKRDASQQSNPTEELPSNASAGRPYYVQNPWNMRDPTPRHDGDVVAISFLSKEDLEMKYAPDGVLKISRDGSNIGRFPKADESDAHGLMEWKLFYDDVPRRWALAHRISPHVEWYIMGDSPESTDNATSPRDNAADRSQPEADLGSLLDEIANYAKAHYVFDMEGFNETSEDVKAAGDANQVQVPLEKLRAWFNEEKKKKKKRGTTSLRAKAGALDGYIPGRDLTVLGYGYPERILARDGLGRLRPLSVRDLSKVVTGAIGPPRGSLDAIRMALGTQGQLAFARGDIEDTEDAYRRLFREIEALEGDEQTRFVLFMHLASNVYKGDSTRSRAAGMYIRALRYSQRLFGPRSVNNFMILTNLAIYYENTGRFDDAVALYRRALRGRINAGLKEDALMNMHELSTVFRKMGKNPEALQFVEEAYTGYKRVSGPDHRMTLMMLSNLALFLCQADSTERGLSLLGPAIPVINRVFGSEDPLASGSLGNFLKYSKDSNFPPGVVQVIDQYMAQNTSVALSVMKTLADHYDRKGLTRKAMEIHKVLSLKRIAHPELLISLLAYAYSLAQLGETEEALKQYRLLRSEHARLLLSRRGEATSLLSGAQIRAAYDEEQDLTRRQKALEKEKADWGLVVARKCSRESCNNGTVRFCTVCNLVRFCSPACEREDTSHHDACIPAVTLAQSNFIFTENVPNESSLSADANLFFTDMQLPRQPRSVSARDVFINPKNFATIRISKCLPNMLSVRVNPQLDLRFVIHGSAPFKWLTPDVSNLLCMFEGKEDSFILVAPGKTMMRSLVTARDAVFGIESDDPDLPDRDLIEYAQTSSAGVGRRGYVLGFQVVEWVV